MKDSAPFVEELKQRGLYDAFVSICRTHGALLDEIYQGHRTPHVVNARHAVWEYLTALRWSSVEIGRLFGVHYTSVGTALRKNRSETT